MKNKYWIYSILLVAIISFLTIGYSAFNNQLNIDDLLSYYRAEANIRITNLNVQKIEGTAKSQYEEYGKSTISSEVTFSDNESSVTYEVDVTNFGSPYMVISGVTGLSDDLEYNFENYQLNTPICDDENQCNLGITKKIHITIKPSSSRNLETTKYNIKLGLEFAEFSYTINYFKKQTIQIDTDLNYNDSTNDSITETDGVYTINKSGKYTGLFISSDYFEDGETYLLKYKLKKTDGTLVNIGGHSTQAIEKKFTIDGEPSNYSYDQPKTNLIDDENEHIIEFTFEYDSDVITTGTLNLNIYIQVNRTGGTATPVVVDIYDIELYKVIKEEVLHYNETASILTGPDKKAYVFTEWNTEIDGSGNSYTEGQKITNLLQSHGSELNLYPQWVRKSYAGFLVYDMVEDQTVLGDRPSEYVTSETGIDFAKAASDTNGKGVYTFTGTENDTYPTYYYRGMVDNNNVIFGNYCWKIVRTTETGGTKLFYNGVPTDGKCNSTGDATQLASKIKYNSTGPIEAGGYAYGSTHSLKVKVSSNIPVGTIFANDVTYVDGAYVLDESTKYVKDADFDSNLNTIMKTHHYTCSSTEDTTCSTVYYYYMARGTAMYYITLTNGEKIEDILNNTLGDSTNTTSSTIKTYIDNWYSTNMTTFTPYLEDTAWCNDRSISVEGGWNKNGELLDEAAYKLNFGGNDRLVNNEVKTPSLTCANVSDRFTVSKNNGNGALTYPVALLTMDEAALAGYVWGAYSYNNYLNNDKVWWTMTPTLVSVSYVYMGVAYSILDNVHTGYISNSAGGVRPSISLKNEVRILGGYGTIDEPFTIKEVEYVSIDNIYDPENKVESMLHIGDFVNYDAGTWTQSEIDDIKVGLAESPTSANNSLDLPEKVAYQFGGFQIGTSRNSTSAIAQFEGLGEVSYIQDTSTNKPIEGWRVFDINEETGEVTLISAGNPEAFYQTNTSDAGYSTPYIFSGTIHSSWGEENAKKYLKRNWSPYINKSQGAKAAYILSKDNLETWYNKHIGVSSDLWTIPNFQQIYSYPRLHNIIDNYSFWWLSSTRAAAGPHFVQGDADRRLRGGNDVTLGIRVNVVLSNEAKFSINRVGTKELASDHLTDYGGNQVYNVWNLETVDS